MAPSPTPRDRIDEWIIGLAPGRSFVDIGGIGVGAGNERTSTASLSGASRVAQADIRPIDYFEWEGFRQVMRSRGVDGVEEFDRIDIRDANALARLGVFDTVHTTGIFYHLPSPADALWNLRKVTGRHLITNTVTFPGAIENGAGTLRLPDAGVLFLPALTEQDRRVLNQHYQDKFGWSIDQTAPPLDRPNPGMPWIEDGELTCWPYWYLYTDHAFRKLLELCRFRVIDEFKWQDHTLQVLCEVIA